MMLLLVLCLVSGSGVALAQTDGPDPDSPIQIPTDDANDDDLPEETPTKAESDTPTIHLDLTSTPTAASTPDDDDATPVVPEASTVAAAVPDLAAMTLDSRSMPDEFQLIGEAYTPIEELLDAMLGLIDRDELLATGILALYQSTYVNVADGSTIKTYVISYETVDGVQAGFDILENEELLVPNGALEDLPGLEGVGQEPSEVTTGTIEVGDGTRTCSYDVTFRVDRYQAGVAMETRDGSPPPADVIDGLAAELAERVGDVVAGNDVDQVVYELPDRLIQLEVAASYEGYQSADETILADDSGSLRDGYLSGYYRAGTFSDSVTSILPYVTIGVNQFASAADVEAALSAPEAMMPFFDELTEIGDIEIDGSDAVLAFGFSSPQGAGVHDSIRLFIQVDDQLISIDVQGMDSLDAAQAAAFDLAELQVDCTLNAICGVPGGIGNDAR
jgi:hypothetical protein